MHFGFVGEQTGCAVVVGEWDGLSEAAALNTKCQKALAAYLKTGVQFAPLNQSGGDTGDLLFDDSASTQHQKQALVKDLVLNEATAMASEGMMNH